MQTISFGDVVAELRPIYEAKSRKTFLDFDTATRLHLLPYFAEKPIAQCGALWRHYAASERTKNPLRKLRHDKKNLSIILRYAFECGYIDRVPRLVLDPFDRSRREGKAVTADELALVCQFASPSLRDFLKLLFLTGMRSGELRNLRVDQVDFVAGLVRLHPFDTKTRRGRTYPLLPQARAILLERHNRLRCAWFFPNRDRTGPMSNSQKAWQIARKKAGLMATLHDFRRGFVRNAVRSGMPIELVAKLIGCSAPLIRDVYLICQEDDWRTRLIDDSAATAAH